MLCLGQDITAKQKEQEILTRARNEAENLSKLKDAFVANVSHEVHKLFSILISSCELLLIV